MRKKFYKYKELGPCGTVFNEHLNEDFVNRHGEKDSRLEAWYNIGEVERIEDSWDEFEVVEVCEELFASYTDMLSEAIQALKKINGQKTFSKDYDNMTPEEIAARALRIMESHRDRECFYETSLIQNNEKKA